MSSKSEKSVAFLRHISLALDHYCKLKTHLDARLPGRVASRLRLLQIRTFSLLTGEPPSEARRILTTSPPGTRTVNNLQALVNLDEVTKCLLVKGIEQRQTTLKHVQDTLWSLLDALCHAIAMSQTLPLKYKKKFAEHCLALDIAIVMRDGAEVHPTSTRGGAYSRLVAAASRFAGEKVVVSRRTMLAALQEMKHRYMAAGRRQRVTLEGQRTVLLEPASHIKPLFVKQLEDGSVVYATGSDTKMIDRPKSRRKKAGFKNPTKFR